MKPRTILAYQIKARRMIVTTPSNGRSCPVARTQLGHLGVMKVVSQVTLNFRLAGEDGDLPYLVGT